MPERAAAMHRPGRRHFLTTALAATAGLAALPNLLTGRARGATGPNQLLQVVQIGCGRMGMEDMQGVLKCGRARIVGVCDLDRKRATAGQAAAERFYHKSGGVRIYQTYQEALADRAVDAVIVSLPDHWHGLVAIAAAIAGKHLYVQKPLTYNIAESIALRTAVRAKKVILQTGSQQRSEHPFGAFRAASAAVRNGRVGTLKSIRIGVGIDKPSGKRPTAMPVPAHFDFQTWLGPAPQQDYMEGRVHPQGNLGRPGWITTEDFGLGMITNWGAHHLDIAQWAMGQELGGPQTIHAKADFMRDDLWTVHHHYHIEMTYPGGITIILDDKFENGIEFIGEEGTVFCARGAAKVTATDPNAPTTANRALRASKGSILAPLGPDATQWPASPNHYTNWIDSVHAGTAPIAPVDQAAKSLQACAAAWIGMKLGRPLKWDAATEEFPGDAEANALRSRSARKPEYDIDRMMKQAGLG